MRLLKPVLNSIRDENLARRGIESQSSESQINAIKDQGEKLLENYKAELGDKNSKYGVTMEGFQALEPVQNSLDQLNESFGELKTSLFGLS